MKMNGTTKCQSRHDSRVQRSERRSRRTKMQKSYGHRCRWLLRHMRVHYDPVMKHKNSSYALQNKPEPQGRELQCFKLSSFVPEGSMGILHVRMTGMRHSNEKKLLQTKEGERHFHFAFLCARRASCPHRDETRGMEKVDELQCRCYFVR